MVTLSARPRALLSGYGLGVAGAILALVLTGAVFLLLGVLSTVGLEASVPLSVNLVIAFVFGQYVPFMGFPLAYFRRRRQMTWEDIREYVGVRVPSLAEAGLVLGGLIAVFVLVSAMAFLVQTLGLDPASNNAGEIAQETPSIAPVLALASLVVIGPCEEMLFRGTVQNRLREAFSAPVAITLAAVLFASIHVTALTGGLGARFTTIGILLVPSFVFGVTYEYTQNLVVPALVHGLWNAFLFTSIWIASQADLPTGAVLLWV